MTENMKQYRTKCEIEYSQEYLPSRDITLIFEDTFVWSKNVNDEPEEYAVRERITGFYHGEPSDDMFKQYINSGTEAIMTDELIESLTNDSPGQPEGEQKESHLEPDTYHVVLYGDFDEVPLIRYQRSYTTMACAIEEYEEIVDTMRLEHKIIDNEQDVEIWENDCSAIAIVKEGPFDQDSMYKFKLFARPSNLKTCKAITDWLIENGMLNE